MKDNNLKNHKSQSVLTKLATKTISKQTRDIIFTIYPSLEINSFYCNLFFYLLFPTQQENGRPITNEKTLKELFGFKRKLVEQTCNTEELLKEFSNNVCKIEWTEHRYIDKKARTITLFDVDKKVIDAIIDDRSNWIHGRVYALTGKVFTKAKMYNQISISKLYARSLKATNSHSQYILDYMNGLDTNIFTAMMRKNAGEVERALHNRPQTTKEDKQWVLNQARIFHNISENVIQLYKPTDNSPRLFSIQEGLANIHSPLRRILTAGQTEIDLKSMHLASWVTLWGIPELKQLLMLPSFGAWTELNDGSPCNEETKVKIKGMLYCAGYGGGKDKAIEKHGVTEEEWERFIKTKWMKLIIPKRDAMLRKIKEFHGDINCWGEWIGLARKTEERKPVTPLSVLSQLSQAVEVSLIEKVFEIANQAKERKDGFIITVYSFDGVTISFFDEKRKEYWLEKIKQAVGKEARRLEILTYLETEELS